MFRLRKDLIGMMGGLNLKLIEKHVCCEKERYEWINCPNMVSVGSVWYHHCHSTVWLSEVILN